MLSAEDLARPRGDRDPRRAVDDLGRHGLAGILRHGTWRYPGFQFVRSEGAFRVAPAWTELRRLLQPGGYDDADLLAWASAPNAWLEGRSPAEEIQRHPHHLTEGLATAVARFLPPTDGPEQSTYPPP